VVGGYQDVIDDMRLVFFVYMLLLSYFNISTMHLCISESDSRILTFVF
jgi:hypothetical protein